MKSFLLADPALLAPSVEIPCEAEIGKTIAFWQRLIDWGGDQRLWFGPMTLQQVYVAYEDLGWGTFVDECPVALKREARRAVYRLLAKVKRPATEASSSEVPSIAPNHRGGAAFDAAIGSDAVTLCDEGLVGVASHVSLWGEAGMGGINFTPGPPDFLPLVMIPNERLASEVDDAVQVRLKDHRITIVGGWGSTRLRADITDLFEVEHKNIRWITANRKTRLNLDCLSGVGPKRDVVVCIIGFIGHSGSARVRAICEPRGVHIYEVQDHNEIIALLRSQFGSEEDSSV